MRVTVNIGNAAMVLSYLNTVLFEHAEPYEMFDHVYLKPDEDGNGGKMIMREASPELWEQLVENKYPRMYAPYPTEADEEAVLVYNDAVFEAELEGFGDD